MGALAGMNLPEAYRRAAWRYQRLAPGVGVIGTLWGIHVAFQRVPTGPASLELLIPPSELFEALGVATVAGFAVFASLLLIERHH